MSNVIFVHNPELQKDAQPICSGKINFEFGEKSFILLLVLLLKQVLD